MQLFQITSVIALLGALADALPTPADTWAGSNGTLEARGEIAAYVKVFHDDRCSNPVVES